MITANGPDACSVVNVLDEVQREDGGPVDACGPVFEDPARSLFVWLVAPGTSDRWQPHRYAACLGRPRQIVLPPLDKTRPPGGYWLRPFRSDRIVPPASLRELLDHFRPGPVPHDRLFGAASSATL
ncbi:hypothetical protein GCM10023080_031060 [Streptomyces pseudoechinosporeus]